MPEIIIFHTADWQFTVDHEEVKQRHRQREWLARFLALAAAQADCVLVAGDLFNSKIDGPDEEKVQVISSLLRDSSNDEARVPVLILDSTTHTAGPHLETLESVPGVTVFRADTPAVLGVHEVHTGSGTVRVVPVVLPDQGRSSEPRARRKARVADNHAILAEACALAMEGRTTTGDDPWVLLAHGDAASDFHIKKVKHLGGPGAFDYMALGHRDSARGLVGDQFRDEPTGTDNCILYRSSKPKRCLALFPGAPDHSTTQFPLAPRFLEVALTPAKVRATQQPWGDAYTRPRR